MKQIEYIIGSYCSGKTTRVKNSDGYKVIEDDALVYLLSNDYLYHKHITYISSLWYKILEAIKTEHPIIHNAHPLFVVKRDKDKIIVDGHPMLGACYAKAYFDYEKGKSIGYGQVLKIQSFAHDLYRYIRKDPDFQEYKQTAKYINLPTDHQLKLIAQRYKERENMFPEEIDKDWLILVKDYIDNDVKTQLNTFYETDWDEINSLY